MNNYKIGRNDLCPCGSGKKYKNCCLGLDEIAGPGLDMFERYNKLLTELKLKLDSYYGSSLKKNRREVLHNFLRFSDAEILPADHEALFSDWLWFDFSRDSGPTWAQEYYAEHGKYMEKPLADCLRQIADSYLSIYTPLEISNSSLLLEDLVSGNTCQVLLREPWEINESIENLLLMGRVIRTLQGAIFSGMVLMGKNDADQKNFISSNLDYFKLISGLDGADFAKRYGEIIYGIFCHALSKTKLSLNDVRFIPHHDSLPPEIVSGSLIPLYRADGWQWFQPSACVGYVRVALREDAVLICTDLAEDLPMVNSWLARLGPDESVNISNMLHAPDLDQTSLWFTIMKDQETERWLHTPHRELDGKTPAEFLPEDKGRQKLIDLVDAFAAEPERSAEEKELLLFMRERINGIIQ